MTITQTPLRHSSYLIQRLEPPFENPGPLGDNPFSFGGGYKNGGLSDEAMSLLNGIFRFDYMGAAEFEFGSVPKALNKIAKAAESGDLDAWEFEVLYSKIKAPDCWRKGEEEINPPAPRSRATLYAIAPGEWREAVEDRVAALASKKPPHLKEWTMLPQVLRPTNTEYQPTVRGWLELDNGFMFFADRTMWAKTAALFGIEVDDG
jgi:hypothetical protein